MEVFSRMCITLKDFISCHTAGEGAFIGSLDNGAFRSRVGKGNAKLNKISPGLLHGIDKLFRDR